MRSSIFLIFALLLSYFSWSQHSDLDRYMQAQESVNGFTGAVLVAKKGEIIYQNAFGFANREWLVANTFQTRFPIASLTKQFTAAAILRLEEEGKLRLDDKLSSYYPTYPNGDSITLHMLLNHTAGIYNLTDNPDFFKLDLNQSAENINDSLLINLFKDKPVDFSPGTFWKYSNSGYILLSFIIEKTSGMAYGDYLQQQLFQKASMQDTALFSYDSIIPNFANGYARQGETWMNARIDPINYLLGAGGLVSTVGDLFKWTQALNAGKIIDPASLAKMYLPNHELSGYGYGFFIDRFFDKKAMHHSGGINGYNSYMVHYPEEELTIIILTNRDTILDFIHKGIAGIIFGKEVRPVYKHTLADIDTAHLKLYSGTYEGAGVPFPVSIVEKDSKLYLSMGEDIELFPESETKFFINQPDVDIQVVFKPNHGGKSKIMDFIEGGISYPVIRKDGT